MGHRLTHCLASLVLGTLLLAGCSKPVMPPELPAKGLDPVKTAEKPAATDGDTEKKPAKSPEELAKEEKLKQRYEKAIAKLSKEDAALARYQVICPVMEKPLGSMGMPVKVDVAGRSVFICCEGCREELLEKTDESLKRIPPAK